MDRQDEYKPLIGDAPKREDAPSRFTPKNMMKAGAALLVAGGGFFGIGMNREAVAEGIYNNSLGPAHESIGNNIHTIAGTTEAFETGFKKFQEGNIGAISPQESKALELELQRSGYDKLIAEHDTNMTFENNLFDNNNRYIESDMSVADYNENGEFYITNTRGMVGQPTADQIREAMRSDPDGANDALAAGGWRTGDLKDMMYEQSADNFYTAIDDAAAAPNTVQVATEYRSFNSYDDSGHFQDGGEFVAQPTFVSANPNALQAAVDTFRQEAAAQGLNIRYDADAKVQKEEGVSTISPIRVVIADVDAHGFENSPGTPVGKVQQLSQIVENKINSDVISPANTPAVPKGDNITLKL